MAPGEVWVENEEQFLLQWRGDALAQGGGGSPSQCGQWARWGGVGVELSDLCVLSSVTLYSVTLYCAEPVATA